MSGPTDLIQQAIKTIFIPVHPAGWPFIIGFAIVTLILMQLGDFLGGLGIVLTLWCVYFFRNPKRMTPTRDGLVISPADGMVQMITKAPLPPELKDSAEENDGLFKQDEVTRVSIFLNVFDVHINRIPADGKITKVVYHPGKFFNASLDKASTDNERSTVLMKMNANGQSVAFVQIAGLVARRIICTLKDGQETKAGEIYGLIRFGSRVDIYLPDGVEPLVSVGQRMIGGETVIADTKSDESARVAEDRAPATEQAA